MATNVNENSNCLAGWEITPYVPLPISSTEPPFGEIKQTENKRRLSSAKVVETSYIYFKFYHNGDDPAEYALELCDDKSSPELEEGMTSMEHLLPLPGLLKGWKKETRERPNGTRDKFYFDAMSTKTFRSVIEVVEYIKSKNNLVDATGYPKSKELQGATWIKPSEATSSSDKKRKNSGNEQKSDCKKRSNFSGGCGKKTPEQLALEESYADAYSNLLNMFPPTTDTMAVEEKSAVEAFLAEAQQNLLKAFEGEENGRDIVSKSCEVDLSPQEIEEIIKDLTVGGDAPQILRNSGPLNIQQGENAEIPNPQKAMNQEHSKPPPEGMNERPVKETEVVQIVTEVLDKGNDSKWTDQEIARFMAYSPPIIDPVDPNFFWSD